MPISVSPQQFTYVYFDATLISDAAMAVVEQLGMADQAIDIVVDETTPLARVSVDVGPPIVVVAESGAFEDMRKPRHLSERNVTLNLGMALLKARDRLDGTFGEAPPHDDLTLAQVALWDAYAAGRMERLGHDINRQRYLYNFRNRHGFTDIGDGEFGRVWSSERMTWSDLTARSDAAMAANLTAAG